MTELPAGGLPIGRRSGKQILTTVEESIAVIGPPRSGKTSSVFIPAVACHEGPVIVTSTRPDLRNATLAARRRHAQEHGGVVLELLLDEGIPAAAEAYGVFWDLAEGCDDWNTAWDRACGLVDAAMSGSDDQHWRSTAQKLLGSTLFVGRREGLDARAVRRLLEARDLAAIREYLAWWADEDAQAEEAFYTLESILGDGAAAPDELASAFSTLTSQVFGSLRYTSTQAAAPFDLDTFLSGSNTIYITVRGERAPKIRSLIAAFVEMVTAAWRSRWHAGAQGARLLLALDEVANVAPIPSLTSLVTAGGGDGIQAILGFQDPAQVAGWGREGQLLLDGPAHTVLFPGLFNKDYLSTWADLLGSDLRTRWVVRIRPGSADGSRFASVERLERERQEYEAVVHEHREGPKARIAGPAVQLLGLRLRAERLRDGVIARPGFADDADGTIAEILSCTSVEDVVERRPDNEVHQLFKGQAPRTAIVRSGTSVEYREFPRHYEDAQWQSRLGAPG